MGSSSEAKLGYGLLFDVEELDALRTEEETEEDEEGNVIWNNEDKLTKLGLNIMYHGNGYSGQEEGLGLVVSKSYLEADEWSPKAIKIPAVGKDWDKKLETICKELGLKYRQPSWCLCCYYG